MKHYYRIIPELLQGQCRSCKLFLSILGASGNNRNETFTELTIGILLMNIFPACNMAEMFLSVFEDFSEVHVQL